MQSENNKKVATVITGNRLINLLPSVESLDVLRNCSVVELGLGDVLVEPGQNISYVYFPSTAFISTTVSVSGSATLEVGLVGSEGMFGVQIALGVNVAPMRAIVQGEGEALQMSSNDFRTLLGVGPVLRRVLHRYSHVLATQTAQVAACSAFHTVEARLARWLLMTHDRAPTNTFQVTHERLAEMLGVRRSGLSIAAGALQSRELISYRRGRVTVTDRPGLEAASCDCYRAAEEIYNATL